MADQDRCNFCLRGPEEVARLLGGDSGARICDSCVAACGRILADPSVPFPGFAGDDDEQLLGRLAPARDLVEAAALGLQGLVDRLRERGVSWARVGDALGVSRQAAWERFG
ncbi:MAG: ClpX C4-type zinc finger protein [Actinomycetota bacterium]